MHKKSSHVLNLKLKMQPGAQSQKILSSKGQITSSTSQKIQTLTMEKILKSIKSCGLSNNVDVIRHFHRLKNKELTELMIMFYVLMSR